MLTSQQKSSVFSSPAACCRSPLLEHQRNCSMPLFESTTRVEFSFFFFSQCYSCSNKHWLLMMQVPQLHSPLCALICLLSGSRCWPPSGCHWTQDHVGGLVFPYWILQRLLFLVVLLLLLSEYIHNHVYSIIL